MQVVISVVETLLHGLHLSVQKLFSRPLFQDEMQAGTVWVEVQIVEEVPQLLLRDCGYPHPMGR